MLKVKKIFIILFIVALLILIGLGVWIGVTMFGNHETNPTGPSEYSAVYMTSGDIYFGKLHSFPKPYLSDALYLVKSTNQSGQTQIGLAPFSSVFWAPAGKIYFNPDQVLFTAPLQNSSQIISAIKNPSILTQNSATQQQGNSSNQSTTTTGSSNSENSTSTVKK
jgi:hypothetical protein